MSDALVKGEGVGRRFRQGDADVCALQPASFMIRRGDRIALLGRSGSGKSTLLDLIADLDAPTTGRLTWPALGQRGALRPKHIGVAFQSPSLIPTLNVVENVEVPLRLAGEAAAARGMALKALEALDLADLADRLPDELSGGQSQRVALARAMAITPRLILADEPTGQLDHPTGRRAIDALLSSIDGTDAALVIATHDSAVAERMKAVWLMDHGCLQISGARKDL